MRRKIFTVSNHMHAIQLATLAHVYATQASAQLNLRLPVKREAAHAFWLANRLRHEFWSGKLAAHRSEIQKPGVCAREIRWNEILPVMQEVLISEPLTRCVSLHAANLEELGIDSDFAPLAESALAAHIEARHRCLHLIVFGSGLSTFLAVRLNRLRRSMENYCDRLLAMMRPAMNLGQICFEASEMESIWRLQNEAPAASGMISRVYGHTLQTWLHRNCLRDVDERTANARLNERLANGIMDSFPNELFDSFGVAKSSQATWLGIESAETDGFQIDFTNCWSSPLDVLKTGRDTTNSELQSPKRW